MSKLLGSRRGAGGSRSSSRDRYGTLEDEEAAGRTEGGPNTTSTTAGLGGAVGADLHQSESDDSSPGENDGLMRDSTATTNRKLKNKDSNVHNNSRFEYDSYDEEDDDSEDGDDDGPAMSLQELLYSSSSYYAIAKPVTLTMVLAALAVVFVNNDETRAEGEQAMSNAYLAWSVDSSSTTQNLALSLANALVMVSVICAMTFVIVLLYRFRCMMCLVGYMMLCSGVLLGILGGNLLQVAIHIYHVPVDKLSYCFFVFNFCIVGVMAVFWAKGIPKYVTQGYLVCTSVILAWHLSYFDDWTTWSLLFMLALYDLCAVLTPCGPLKALVNLMSEEEAPEMPGLLFEAELPSEAKRPGLPKSHTGLSQNSEGGVGDADVHSNMHGRGGGVDGGSTSRGGAGISTGALSASSSRRPSTAAAKEDTGGASAVGEPTEVGPTINIPLAMAKVYNLKVLAIPEHSKKIMFPRHDHKSNIASSPLLQEDEGVTGSENLPENPTPTQLRAVVTVRLPPHGGRIEQVSRKGKRVYLERDRHGEPKRLLWVDRNGKVFAEMRSDDEDGPERNTIRLGLGDFIFYSVLVAKAAQYSFATFAACMLVILAGLGGTLVLLSVYHHALPALPISIFLGVVFYLVTRAFIEPWIEVVLSKPFYV